MKLKSLSASNFKSIGREGLTIHFSPITLLFGPNNVGKSTIIQALYLAYEFFCKDSPDYDRMEEIKLGRFDNYVHDRDLALPVTISLTVEISDVEFEKYLGLDINPYPPREEYVTEIEDTLKEKNVSEITVEFSLAWSVDDNHSIVDSFTVFLGDEKFFTVTTHCYNDEMPYVGSVSTFTELAEKFVSDFRAATQGTVSDNIPGVREFKDKQFWFPLGKWGTPDWNSDLATYVLTKGPERDGIETSGSFSMNSINFNISNTFLKPCHAIRDMLKNFVAIGPLREIPDPSISNRNSWWNGVAAWDMLINISPKKLARINKYLANPDYFDTGYRIIQAKTHEIAKDDPTEQVIQSLLESFEPYYQNLCANDGEPVNWEMLQNIFKGCIPKIILGLPSMETLLNQPYNVKVVLKNDRHEVSPNEMGTGISQIVPVLVAACAGKEGAIVAIEQPELHIHPAWQTALGDIFIREANNGSGPGLFLLETHSEHLMLRLLRRIRETTEKELPENFPSIKPDEVNVYYIHKNPEGILEAVKIPLSADGEFEGRWPNGFFRERMREFI